MPGAEIMRSQMAAMLRAQGATPEVLATTAAAQKKVIDAVLAGADEATLRALVLAQLDASLSLATEKEREGVTPGMKKTMLDSAVLQVTMPAARSFIRPDPRPTLEQLQTRVLALGAPRPACSAEPIQASARADQSRKPDDARVLPSSSPFQPQKGPLDDYQSIETLRIPLRSPRSRPGCGTTPPQVNAETQRGEDACCIARGRRPVMSALVMTSRLGYSAVAHRRQVIRRSTGLRFY